MVDEKNENTGSGKLSGHEPKKQNYWPLFVGLLLFDLVVAAVWIGWYKYWPIPEPLQFFTVNIFSLLVFNAIVFQAVIAYQQWQVAAIAVAPKIRIKDVTVAGLEVGSTPAFLVRLVNEGATAAKITIHLRVEGNLGGSDVGLKWNREQSVIVNGNDEQIFFVHWDVTLTEENVESLVSSKNLTVSGYWEEGSIKKDFSYKYYAWIGRRPKGMPEFVPSDFDPGRTYLIHPQPPHVNATFGEVTTKVLKADKKAADDQTV